MTIVLILVFVVLVLWGVDVAMTWILLWLPPRPKREKPGKEEMDAFHKEVRRLNGDE